MIIADEHIVVNYSNLYLFQNEIPHVTIRSEKDIYVMREINDRFYLELLEANQTKVEVRLLRSRIATHDKVIRARTPE